MIQPRALDINAVIHHVQPLLPPILGENVELQLRLAPDLGVVYADPRQIEQIVMNLVLNARDAMPQGGRVTIETSAVQLGPGRAWQRRVSVGSRCCRSPTPDTAWTRPPCSASGSRSSPPSRPGTGTGLGLASVYGAVKQSGGFVWADSEPGRGTHGAGVLARDPRRGGAAGGARAALPPLVGGTETMLIVEDEELVRALAVRALRSFGYTCHQARDASRGAPAARRRWRRAWTWWSPTW